MNTKLSSKAISSSIYNDLVRSGWKNDEAQGLAILLEAALNLAFEKVKDAGINMEDILMLPEAKQREALKPMIEWVIRLITSPEVGKLLAEAAAGNLAYTVCQLH